VNEYDDLSVYDCMHMVQRTNIQGSLVAEGNLCCNRVWIISDKWLLAYRMHPNLCARSEASGSRRGGIGIKWPMRGFQGKQKLFFPRD